MRALFAILGIVALSYPAGAGVYGTSFCTTSSECEMRAFLSMPGTAIPPFAIAHPPGFDGSGGELEYRICIGEGSESLRGPLSRAIATWNALVATTENCTGCKVHEDGLFSIETANAETTLIHELGHCPMALEHPTRNWDPQPDGFWEFTSYTRSVGVLAPPNGIQVGGDFIRGTLDDVHQAGGGMIPDSVHWFRIADNNPFVVDNTVIDSTTYSRSVVNDLPMGHSWAVNANRVVGEQLGFANTQSVMYPLQSEGERKLALTADDVAMVKLGMTGQDRLAGTADDYTIKLTLLPDCDEKPIDIVVAFGVTPPDVLAGCENAFDFSFPQNPFLTFHVSLTAPNPGDPLLITLSDDVLWDLGDEVFNSDFETGDTSEWDGIIALSPDQDW